MTMTASAVSRSARLIRRQLLEECRFLGLHQLWFALLLMPVISYGLALRFDPTGWWLALVGLCLAWLVVEALFLPRRLAVWRMAARESRDERCRQARRHGVAVHQVTVVDEMPASSRGRLGRLRQWHRAAFLAISISVKRVVRRHVSSHSGDLYR